MSDANSITPNLPRGVDRPLHVVYLTSGAAGMICGSCLHDNTLARALTRAGVDIQLVPTYTPIKTDEPDASESQVFFGGLNVYFAQKIPGYAWLPLWMTNWLDHPALLRWATSFAIQTNARDLGALAVSMLEGERGRQRHQVAKLVNWLAAQPRIDVLHFTNLLIGGCIPTLKRRLGCPVVVTLQGDDIFLDYLPAPFRDQAIYQLKRLVPLVDRFVVNSRYYGQLMADLLEIPARQWEVVPLTIDTTDFERASPPPSTTKPSSSSTIGYLARLAPEKGLHVLVDAFLELKRRPGAEAVRLAIAGWLGPQHRAYAESQFAKLRAAGWGECFEYVGEIDRRTKVEFLRGLDVFSVPTTYRDPKGLFALESLAAGVPVVMPSHGGFPEMLERVGGGLLVPPEDPVALADALQALLGDEHRRERLGAAGRAGVLSQANSKVLVDRTLALYGELLSRGPASQ
ncbi:MAG: glycosyltransferase family 4 protein [Pirellulales bacterium]